MRKHIDNYLQKIYQKQFEHFKSSFFNSLVILH